MVIIIVLVEDWGKWGGRTWLGKLYLSQKRGVCSQQLSDVWKSSSLNGMVDGDDGKVDGLKLFSRKCF